MTSTAPQGELRKQKLTVAELRARTRDALRAKGIRKKLPSFQTLTQATFVMLSAGLSIDEIAAALDRSPDHIRVARAQIKKLLGVEAPVAASPARKAAAAKKALDRGCPDHDIDTLHALLKQLPPPSEWGLDVATLRKLGFEPC